MRLIFLLGLLAAPASASAQTTTCNRLGTQTTCETKGASDALSQAIEGMGNPNAPENTYQSMQERQARVDAPVAAAFDRVGALIANGDCAGAARLAQFYGYKDLTKATARACPAK